MSNYSQLLDAIEAYYGRNDIWKSMYEWTGYQGTAQELAKAVEQVPGVRTVRSASGKIQCFEYVGEEYTPHALSDLAAQSVNSNVNVSTTAGMGSAPAAGGGGTATKVKTPVQMDTAGGAVTGMKAGVMQTGKFTLNDVLYPIAAVSAGITLGKWIDSTLYNADPDFWDAQGMASLNPETWDSITIGDDSLNSRVLNMVFGFNGDKTQAYLDENAVAYMVGYMMQKGVFDGGGWEYDTEGYPEIYQTASWGARYSGHIKVGRDSNNPNYYYDVTLPDGVYAAYVQQNMSNSRNLYCVFFSENNFSNSMQATLYPEGTQTTLNLQSVQSHTRDGHVVYYTTPGISMPLTVVATFGYSVTVPTIEGNLSNILCAHIFLTGIETPSVEGISDQEGSTQFNTSGISDPGDIPSILAALQAQFPDLFSDAITNTVIDPETGEEVTTTYLPVGYPQIDPENPTQPIGNISTQTDPAYDPSENPDISDAIAQLISFITDTSGDTPTMQPDDVTNPNPPETGNGNTPVVTPPAGSATALWSIYNPTQAQIDSFGAWLWSNDFVNQLKKIFNDPMESIISLHKVFGTPATGSAQNIAVGYLDSGVSSKVVTAQYTDVDCGSVQLSEYFGNVYDYKDTSVELYLPFIGIVPLSVSDVMRATIHVVYHIDVLTGACLADVEVIRDAGAGGVLYQYSGDCAVHYPVSSGSYIGIVGGILSAGAGIAGTIASGGAAAPLVLGSASALMRMHTDVSRSGGFSANAGAMGAKVPYLIISRPQTALPEEYLDIEGIGSNKTVTLNTCTGYAQVKEVYLQGVGDATEGELNELETLLKAGVIFPITETPTND